MYFQFHFIHISSNTNFHGGDYSWVGENWHPKMKGNRIFYLDSPHEFQNEYKVNVVYKQQDNDLIRAGKMVFKVKGLWNV